MCWQRDWIGAYLIQKCRYPSNELLLDKTATLESAGVPVRSVLHIEQWNAICAHLKQLYCGSLLEAFTTEALSVDGCVSTQPEAALTLDLCSATRWTIFNGLYLANLDLWSVRLELVTRTDKAADRSDITFCSCDWFQQKWHFCTCQQE